MVTVKPEPIEPPHLTKTHTTRKLLGNTGTPPLNLFPFKSNTSNLVRSRSGKSPDSTFSDAFR